MEQPEPFTASTASINTESVLFRDLEWLRQLVITRLKQPVDSQLGSSFLDRLPTLSADGSPYEVLVHEHQLEAIERVALILGLAPHFWPESLDALLWGDLAPVGQSSQFGGLVGKGHIGFIPTGQTLVGLLAAHDMRQRLQVMAVFQSNRVLARSGLLYLEEQDRGEPRLSGRLSIETDWLEYLITGQRGKPKYSTHFPAKLLETPETWEDLVLPSKTMRQLEEINIWLQHKHQLMNAWGMKRKLKPGYNALFYGHSGTGKTMAAALIGKRYGLDVYRIDISQMVSKYIGETEKNLSRIFDRAENKEWILFFDEADALFGKRTDVKDSKDRHANQEVSYLLQRIEDYQGLTILATNLKENIDSAFTRRFQNSVEFPVPAPEERLRLWKKGFPQAVQLEETINLPALSKKYELAGGAINNAIAYACLETLHRGSETITQTDLQEGVRREFAKNGRRL